MIRAGWKVFWLAAIVLAASLGAAQYLVPDVVPVGYAEEAQPSWAVLTAFALRAIELIAAWVAAIALRVMLGAWREAGCVSPYLSMIFSENRFPLCANAALRVRIML